MTDPAIKLFGRTIPLQEGMDGDFPDKGSVLAAAEDFGEKVRKQKDFVWFCGLIVWVLEFWDWLVFVCLFEMFGFFFSFTLEGFLSSF